MRTKASLGLHSVCCQQARWSRGTRAWSPQAQSPHGQGPSHGACRELPVPSLVHSQELLNVSQAGSLILHTQSHLAFLELPLCLRVCAPVFPPTQRKSGFLINSLSPGILFKLPFIFLRNSMSWRSFSQWECTPRGLLSGFLGQLGDCQTPGLESQPCLSPANNSPVRLDCPSWDLGIIGVVGVDLDAGS